jgi:NAD(P)-dependent dehydrogenase (short-subunit alcohol dehydrogenase family)
MRLKDKRALITGSTSGIGRATAQALAREGAHVIVSGRDEARGKEVVAAIRDRGGRADFVAANLADAESTAALATEATRLLDGRIDILVNNAGTGKGGPTAEMTQEDFERIYAVNVRAPYFLTAAIAPAMAEHGSGNVINLGSKTATFGSAHSSLYGSSKAALELLTRCWAAEFGPRGVRVNTVSPGPTLTPMITSSAGLSTLERQAEDLPARRLAHPSEIADAVVFLASQESAYIHGARIPLDGGRSAL